LRLIRPAFKAAEQGKIAVLGIQPRWAETGYGYIEFPQEVQPGSLNPLPVRSFREKPDAKTAAKFVKAGNFYWNAGMFFWKTTTLLDAMREHLPQTTILLEALPAVTSRQFLPSLKEIFPRCENISIDYAVLEKAKNVVGIAADDIGWNDVGSWNAVYELLPRDAHGNVYRSETLVRGSTGNFVDAQGKLVALLGVNNLIVVDTPDALLVADRSRAQEVGDLVKQLEAQSRHELL
jgi:mannose-1-phosphate guanylyltransferase